MNFSNDTYFSDEVYNQVQKIVDQGDTELSAREFELSVKKYNKALSLIPSIYRQCEIAICILSSLSEAYFQLHMYDKALVYLRELINCPNVIGNPFVNLRLGQVQLELGNYAQAQEELYKAYTSEGEEIFLGDDPKYLNFIKILEKREEINHETVISRR